MKFRTRTSLALILLIGLSATAMLPGVAVGASGPNSFQTYADPALAPPTSILPSPPLQAFPQVPSQDYYSSPLTAGTLTLQDVLEAHPARLPPSLPDLSRGEGSSPTATGTAPLLAPPSLSSSTSLMMSQGMKSVLQNVRESVQSANNAQMSFTSQSLNAPPSSVTTSQIPGLVPPIVPSIVPSSPVTAPSPAGAGSAPVAAASTPPAIDASGVKYEPGQEPKNIALSSAGAAAPAPAQGGGSSSETCDPKIQKWEKNCADAGYPASYSGKVMGETRTSCADGALHDFWVSNTCAPPGTPPASPASSTTDTAPVIPSIAASELHQKTATVSAPVPAVPSAPAVAEAVAAAPVPPPAGTVLDAECGSAANTTFDERPVANLCAQGSQSAVSGSGPWTWACSGVNGGKPAACAAQKHVVVANGFCGAANGVAMASAPGTYLCASGKASPLTGDGPWTWTCDGLNGGSSTSCIAPLATAQPTAAPLSVDRAAEVKPIAPVAPLVPASSTAPAVEPTATAAAEPVQAVSSSPSHHVSAPENGASSSSSSADASAKVETKSAEPAATARAAADSRSVTGSGSSEKSDFCGPAAETLAYEAPEKDLCRVGAASSVSGSGPWLWTCTDNGGATSSCRSLSLNGESTAETVAPPKPESDPDTHVAERRDSQPVPDAAVPQESILAVKPTQAASLLAADQKPTCGLASVQPTMIAPTDELCQFSKPSAVHGSGPWTWSCGKGRHKVACSTPKMVDASCGSANGQSYVSAPFAGLCASGTPTNVGGDGPWSWTCNGQGGGVSVTCAAMVQARVDGQCGATANSSLTTAPSRDLCASGTPSTVTGTGPWNWSCSGSNGGGVSTCLASKASPPQAPGPKVDGLCGFANGVTQNSSPTDGLCSSGGSTSVVGSGPWNWNCVGENGGMTVSCTAPLEPPAPIDGTCGDANGVPTLVKPVSALCSSGLTGKVSGKGPWTWTCSGANGGNAASCVAPVVGRTGALPSTMKLAEAGVIGDGSVNAASAAANAVTGVSSAATTSNTGGASSLTTPRLPGAAPSLPALDRQVIPSLTPSHAFDNRPTPSSIPAPPQLSGNPVPDAAPDMPPGLEPVTPPASRAAIVSASALQDGQSAGKRIPGNHLTLDPTISTILFTRGSGNIDDQVLVTLDRLAAVLLENSDVRITLIAYADNTGTTPRDARRLSLTRAQAVRDYLGSKNIPESRVDIRAEGANTTSGYSDRVDVKVND